MQGLTAKHLPESCPWVSIALLAKSVENLETMSIVKKSRVKATTTMKTSIPRKKKMTRKNANSTEDLAGLLASLSNIEEGDVELILELNELLHDGICSRD